MGKSVWRMIALLLITVLAGSGCSTVSKKGLLTTDPVQKEKTIDGARFSLWVNDTDWTTTAKNYYPNLFESDHTALPVFVHSKCSGSSEMVFDDPISASVAAILFLAIPMPMTMSTNSCSGSLLLPGSDGWLTQKPLSYGHVDTEYLTINPVWLLMMPFCHTSKKEISSLEEQTIVQTAFQAITGADAQKLNDAYGYRKSRLGTVDIYGTTYWTYVWVDQSQSKSPSGEKSKNDKYDIAGISFWKQRPANILTPPDESISAATREGDVWQARSVYLRKLGLPKPALATVVLENGRPARVQIKENVKPMMETLIYLNNYNDPEEIRWSNNMLIEAKNTTLAQTLRSGPEQIDDLINRIEKEMLHLSELAQIAEDKANQIIINKGDPGALKTLAVIYRQRITIFQAVLPVLKNE